MLFSFCVCVFVCILVCCMYLYLTTYLLSWLFYFVLWIVDKVQQWRTVCDDWAKWNEAVTIVIIDIIDTCNFVHCDLVKIGCCSKKFNLALNYYSYYSNDCFSKSNCTVHINVCFFTNRPTALQRLCPFKLTLIWVQLWESARLPEDHQRCWTLCLL